MFLLLNALAGKGKLHLSTEEVRRQGLGLNNWLARVLTTKNRWHFSMVLMLVAHFPLTILAIYFRNMAIALLAHVVLALGMAFYQGGCLAIAGKMKHMSAATRYSTGIAYAGFGPALLCQVSFGRGWTYALFLLNAALVLFLWTLYAKVLAVHPDLKDSLAKEERLASGKPLARRSKDAEAAPAIKVDATYGATAGDTESARVVLHFLFKPAQRFFVVGAIRISKRPAPLAPDRWRSRTQARPGAAPTK